jgi:DNA-binding NtrC family response regulator
VKPRILIVDDEERMASVVATALGRAGYDCATAGSGEAALRALDERAADVVVTDWKMPGVDGFELLRRLKIRSPELPVILLTAYGSVPSAVAAMREGAFDYVAKPFDNEELRATVARALEITRLSRENRYLRQELGRRYAPEDVIAESAKSRELLDLVHRVAPSRSTVLIQGESGTGKELVARLLHYWSERVGRPFLAVNCKAFAEGVLESELFGHEKGSFTGATTARAGCFERAAGGTLFLDEIGEISADFQGKLLRVLQEGEVLRVGGAEPRKVEVRVVAATNRRLREEVTAGRYREDLFFRLNVIPIQLTPLRERPEDVLPLARHFLARYAAEAGRTLAMSAEAELALRGHRWAGNVRELENAIERAVVLARSDVITPEDLLLEPAADSSSGAEGALQESLDRATVASARAALEAAGGNRAEAARALGIDRTTLYRLMKRLGI